MFWHFDFYIILFHLYKVQLILAVGPGSPDWDEILANPIAETISRSPSPHVGSPITAERETINQPSSSLNNDVISANAPLMPSEWYVTRKLSMTPRAIQQRERLARLKEEDIDAYNNRRKNRLKYSKSRLKNLNEEKKARQDENVRKAQKRYEERRKRALKLPENAEKAKQFNAKRAKASRESQRRISQMVKSGKGTPEQVERLLKRKKADAINAKRRYQERKAQRKALKSQE